MPPEQCPECGRFLSAAFVEEATPGPQPCPNCATPLSYSAEAAAAVAGVPTPPAAPPTDEPDADVAAVAAAADVVADDDADDDDAATGDAASGAAAATTDVPPTVATPGAGHPLDEWGSGATAPPLVDQPAFSLTPEELALAGGGALLGALVVRRSRLLGAIVGAVAALVTLLSRRE